MKKTDDRIGRWVVQHRLGGGGFGSVYRCHQHNAERIVAAIKVLELPGTKADRKRFLREAEILHGLDHPNVVRLLGVETESDPPYLEMELVTGVSLDERLRSGALPVDEVLRIAAQVAGALAFVHDRGVRHRDIKPANIIIRPDGMVKLVDFGVALDEEADRLTRAGTFLGTPEYAPPEWVSGKPDPTLWDAYAFGVLLYELLLGVVPPTFQRDGRGKPLEQAMRVMRAKDEHPPLDPGPPAPETLRSIIRGLTHPDPALRTSNLSQVKHLLATVTWEKVGSTLVPVRLTPRLPGPNQSLVLRAWSGVQRATMALAGLTVGVAVLVGVVLLAIGLGLYTWTHRVPASLLPDDVPIASAVAPVPRPMPAPTAVTNPQTRPKPAPLAAAPLQVTQPQPEPVPLQAPTPPPAPEQAPVVAAEPAPTQQASTVRLHGDAVRVQLVRGSQTKIINDDEIFEVPPGTWRVDALWTIDGDWKRAMSALNVNEGVAMVLDCSGSSRMCFPAQDGTK